MPVHTAAAPAAGAEPLPDPPSVVAGPTVPDEAQVIAGLITAGQHALAEHDQRGAVIIFRKWVYLAPDDPIAHLHLALALEAFGDDSSARRAFGAARRALPDSESALGQHALEGYAPTELRKLLDTKLGAATQRGDTEHDRTRP